MKPRFRIIDGKPTALWESTDISDVAARMLIGGMLLGEECDDEGYVTAVLIEGVVYDRLTTQDIEKLERYYGAEVKREVTIKVSLEG